MTGSGDLYFLIAFEEVAAEETSYGVVAGEWDEQFQRKARIRARTGTEPVIAQRLQGVQPLEIEVRSDSETRLVTTAWRIRNVRTSEYYQIGAIAPSEKRMWISMACELGPAVNG